MLHKMRIVNKFADERFKAMADQIVQMFEIITYILVFLIIIMLFNLFTLGTNEKRRNRKQLGISSWGLSE